MYYEVLYLSNYLLMDICVFPMAYYVYIKLCKYERIWGTESMISTSRSLGMMMRVKSYFPPCPQTYEFAPDNTAPYDRWYNACTLKGLWYKFHGSVRLAGVGEEVYDRTYGSHSMC